MKKKILVGVLVFVTVVGIAFAAKTYKCKQCGTNTVSRQGDICAACEKNNACNFLNKEEKKEAENRNYSKAEDYKKVQDDLGCE